MFDRREAEQRLQQIEGWTRAQVIAKAVSRKGAKKTQRRKEESVCFLCAFASSLRLCVELTWLPCYQDNRGPFSSLPTSRAFSRGREAGTRDGRWALL